MPPKICASPHPTVGALRFRCTAKWAPRRQQGRKEGGKLSSLFLQGSKILSAQSANLEVHGIRRGNSGAHVMRAQSMVTHSEMPKSGYESVFACKTSDFEHQIQATEAVVKLLRLQSWLRE